MNTTENTYVDDSAPKKNADVTKDDAKSMRADYVKGATIDDLALQYGYDSRQVEDAVVTPAPEETPQTVQADEPEATPKKGK